MELERLRLLIWALFALFGFIVFLFLLKNLSKLKHQSSSSSPPSISSLISISSLTGISRDMSFATISSATDNFSALNLIKVGHSGEFFTGRLSASDEKIVVKRAVRDECKKELELYASLHINRCLVPLLGQCEDEEEGFYLVYRYMENGDLANALAQKKKSLSWILRLKIAQQTAEALLFLHYGCTSPILHSDVKSSSVLMGKNYQVRLGSLGLAKKVEKDKMLSYDVWCFGKLLMDLISGLDVSGEEDPYAQKWLNKTLACTDRDGLLGSIDPSLVVDDDLAKEILGVIVLAKACLIRCNHLTMKMIRQVLEQPAWIGDGIGSSVWADHSVRATVHIESS